MSRFHGSRPILIFGWVALEGKMQQTTGGFCWHITWGGCALANDDIYEGIGNSRIPDRGSLREDHLFDS